MRTEDGTDRLIWQAPHRLQGGELEHQKSAAAELAELTATDPEHCAAVLRRFLLQGSTLRRSASSRFPIFAFRLHQFFTRGDTVWATLEAEAERHLEMAKMGSKPGEPDTPLFPLVFCRPCGTAYYRAKMFADEHGRVLAPREDRREETDDGSGDVYIYVSASAPWPRTDSNALLDRLPAFMKEITAQGVERLRPDARGDVPEPVWVDAHGRIVAAGAGMPAALIHRDYSA